MKRHLKWLVYLLLIPLTYMAAVYGLYTLNKTNFESTGAGFIGLIILALWAVFTVIFTIRFIRSAYAAFRQYRRSKGHFNKTERTQLESQRAYESGLESARTLAKDLSQGQTPAPIEVWGIVLEPGEELHLQISCDYARFYGLSGQYVHTSGFFWRQPAFVLAGLGVTALANRSRRQAAEAASRQQWREMQRTSAFFTSRRILIQVGGRWLSFYYSGVSACYPEPENHSVVLDFPDTQPLLIGGPEAPLAAAYLVWALYGERGLASHPALQGLRA